jgi:nitrate/TMAO reductase-like tetraheme cytochrome c subunit
MPFADMAGVALGAETVSAQPGHETTALALEQPFVGKGSAADWAASITTYMSILILVIVIVTIIFERRRAPPSTLNLLRFTGLLVLPIFTMFLGSFATFEGSKKVEFCHSCHSAMDPYVNDMRNKASTTLASLHYNNRYIQTEQCYQCHADYGVWGTIKAKATGLRHLYYWIRNTETARGEKQITLYGHYRNEMCLHCHAGSQRFLKAEDGLHLDMANDFLVNDPITGEPKTFCLDCHGPAHPTLANTMNKEKTPG